jgi:hypothetical protein
MKIKIFKGNLTLGVDCQGIESQVNSFIVGKKIIDIKQSIEKAVNIEGSFLVITVIYEN